MYPPPIAPYHVVDFHMIDAENGFVLGLSSPSKPKLYKTTGPGKDWTVLFDTKPYCEGMDCPEVVMEAYGSKNIWLMIDTGLSDNPEEIVVRYSNDGGATFKKSQPLPISIKHGTVRPIQLFFPNDTIGWLLAVVIDPQEKEYQFILHTTDGGRNWRNVYEFPNGQKYNYSWNGDRLFFIDEKNGYLAGFKKKTNSWNELLFYTDDGGITWQPVKLFESAKDFPFFDGVNCLSVDIYLDLDNTFHLRVRCSNDDYESQNYYFSRTQNGERWETIISKSELFYISKTVLLDLYEGRKSYNSGRDWIQLSKNEYYSGPTDVQAVTNDLLFALRCDGMPCWMIRSTDGGESWENFSLISFE